MKNEKCAYCDGGEQLEKFAIKILELPASRVYLFREQSHRGRVIVATKSHVGEFVDLERREREAFLEDVTRVGEALHRIFSPDKINFGAFGDTCGHAHFHLVPKYADDPFEWGETFAMNPGRTYLSEPEYADLVSKIAAVLYVSAGVDFRRALEAMRRDIVADGVVTLCESGILLGALEPLEGTSAVVDDCLRLLRATRADGRITAEESAEIVRMMGELLA